MWAGLLVGACAPEAAPTLEVVMLPSSFSVDVTQVRARVIATDSRGLIGTGTVTATVDVGTLENASVSLDRYGVAVFVWTCAGTQCETGGNFEARWGDASAASTTPITAGQRVGWLNVNSGTGGGGGGGGGTAPGRTTIKSDVSFKLTGTTPGTGWNTDKAFNDGSWPNAMQVLPESAAPNRPYAMAIWDAPGPSTSTGSKKVHMRKTFTLGGTTVQSALLDISCNDDMNLWINGTQVIADMDGVNTYRLGVDVRQHLVIGLNLFAASCEDIVLPDHGYRSTLEIVTR